MSPASADKKLDSLEEIPFICGVVEGFYGRPWTTEQRKDLFTKLQVRILHDLSHEFNFIQFNFLRHGVQIVICMHPKMTANIALTGENPTQSTKPNTWAH